MAEKIVIEFQEDSKALDTIIAQLVKMGKVDKDNAAQFKKNNADFISGVSKTGTAVKGVGDNFSSLTNTLKGVGAAIGVAFGVQQIINFGKESIKAFREAEVNAQKLAFAIKSIAGEGEDTFRRFIEQSKEFQKNSIFSDDAVQQAQTALIQYGLTTKEIDKLIPKIVDFASAARIDLASATESVILGLEGSTRGLKKYGLAFKDTGDAQENFAIISEKLGKFQGATADALETTAGKAALVKNAADEASESIGQLADKLFGIGTVGQKSTIALQQFLDLLGLIPDAVNKIPTKDPFKELSAVVETQSLSDLNEQLAIQKRLLDDVANQRADGNIVKGEGVMLDNAELEIKKEIALLEKNIGNFSEREQAAINATKEKALAIETKRNGIIKELRVLTIEQLQIESEGEDKTRSRLAKEELKRREEGKKAFEKAAEEGARLAQKKIDDTRKVNDIIAGLTADTEEEKLRLEADRLSDSVNNTIVSEILKQEALTEIEVEFQDKIAALKEKKLKEQHDKERAIELKKFKEDDDLREEEDREDTQRVKDEVDEEERIRQEQFDKSIELTNALWDFKKQTTENQLMLLNEEEQAEVEKLEKELENNELTRDQKLAIEQEIQTLKDNFDEKKLALQKKQAERDKNQALFNVFINTAEAIAKALPNIPLSILAGVLGAVQFAKIESQPLPFAKGTKSVPGERKGVDSVHAMLMPDEMVIPVNKKRRYEPILNAIFDESIAPDFLNNLALSHDMKAMGSGGKQGIFNQVDEYTIKDGMKAALRDGIIVKNMPHSNEGISYTELQLLKRRGII